MSALASDPAELPGRPRWVGGRAATIGAAVALAGCVTLYARPRQTGTLIVLFLVLGSIGILWPGPHMDEPPAQAPVRVATIVVGCLAFGAGRLIGQGHGLLTFTTSAVVLNSLAAIAEEAFFRRFIYGLVAPFGPAPAIAVSAVAFTVVHIHVYGGWVVPIDMCAGALLGWQRWVSRTWSAPAVTHVIANLLALG